MNRRVALCCLFMSFLALNAAIAEDLAALKKSTLKEPSYRNKPEYALLVLGAKCEKQLWMVRDGDVLYFDRNGSGDLTAPEARVPMDAKASAPNEFDFVFDIGKLPGIPGEPVNVQLVTRRLSSLPELNSSMKQAVSRDANAVTYALHLQAQHPSWKGLGVDGRLIHMVGPIDHRGAFLFGKTAKDAPVIHIGGPLQILPYGDQPRIAAGSSREITLAVGTPGVGVGSTAFIGYEKTIPPAALPSLEVKYANGMTGSQPLVQKQELKERCCGVNLYGKLLVPENAPAGKAEVTISLNGWAEGNVASSKLSLEILEKRVKAIPQSVSLHPRQKLTHQDRQGHLFQVKYSPDGTKLFASSYPGGILQWWDTASGNQLKSFDTGSGMRSSALYALLSPDWKTVWISEQTKGKIEMLDKEGKGYIKWSFNNRIRSWNAETGEALAPIQPEDGRNFILSRISPDGRYIIALEELSGTFPREFGRKRAISFYDLQKRQRIPLPSTYGYFSDFLHDGSKVVVEDYEDDETKPSHERQLKAYRLISVPDGKVIRSIPVEGGNGTIHGLSRDGRFLYTQSNKLAQPKNYTKFTQVLQCYDVEKGTKSADIVLGNESDRRLFVSSEDDRWMVTVTTAMRNGDNNQPGELCVYRPGDLTKTATVPMPSRNVNAFIAFHPTSNLAVTTCQTLPKEAFTSRDFELADDAIEQAKLIWVDLLAGKVVRTDILPPCMPGYLSFSKDGKSLLVGVKGAVHLYDVPAEVVK